jgi:hypothetical protein
MPADPGEREFRDQVTGAGVPVPVGRDRELDVYGVDVELVEEPGVGLHVPDELFGDVDGFPAMRCSANRWTSVPRVRGGVFLVVPGFALSRVEPRGRGEGVELVPPVDRVVGGRVRGPVDEGGFRDAVADDGGDAGDAAALRRPCSGGPSRCRRGGSAA